MAERRGCASLRFWKRESCRKGIRRIGLKFDTLQEFLSALKRSPQPGNRVRSGTYSAARGDLGCGAFGIRPARSGRGERTARRKWRRTNPGWDTVPGWSRSACCLYSPGLRLVIAERHALRLDLPRRFSIDLHGSDIRCRRNGEVWISRAVVQDLGRDPERAAA